MARPPKFDPDQLLDAAATAIAQFGPGATVAEVSKVAGAPVGSLYHRFASREDLMVTLWLREIGRFHEGLLALGDADDARAALVESAVHVVLWCDTHRVQAPSLSLYRQSELVTSAPEQLRPRVADVNRSIDRVTMSLIRRSFGQVTPRRRRIVLTATRALPFGLVRPHLGQAMPEDLVDLVRVSTDAALGLLDRPGVAG